jgi:hypothetical protein
LSNLQLSAPLWGCLFLGFLVWRRRDWGLSVLLLASAALFLLLVPIPALAGRLWAIMPAWVDQITDRWPMQRFYPILSAFAPFAGLLAVERISKRRIWLQRSALVILAISCCWSGYEARKFLLRGFRVALSSELSRVRIRGENAVFSVYSNSMLGQIPRYFSFGPINPSIGLHLLDSTTFKVNESNSEAILDGTAAAERRWTRHFIPLEQGAELRPPLTLSPGSSYLLKFNFERVPPPGTLVVTGRNFFGEYPLPTLERPDAFGAVPMGNSNISMFVGDPMSDRVSIRFVGVPGYRQFAPLATVEVVQYHSENLPFRILDLIPLRISVRARKEGWLETPRIFIDGYRATINGEAVQVKRSPDGLVMARVPAGRSLMELSYPGTALLKVSFWMSFFGWLLMPLGWLLWSQKRTLRPNHEQPQHETLIGAPRLEIQQPRAIPLWSAERR